MEAVTQQNDFNSFELKIADGVATVTLNRPDKLNALTFEAYGELRELFITLPDRGDVRSLVLTGQGAGFCSGGDVAEIIGALQDMSPSEVLRFTRMTGATVQAMRECPIPLIAAINGVCAGAGTVLALACDLRVLAKSASFAFLFTRVGLSGADMGAGYLLPRIVGLGAATELLMLGNRIDADHADRVGLAHRVVADEDLPAVALELAHRLAAGPAWAHATTKALLTRELDMDLASSIELEAWAQALMMKSDDHAEFYAAWSAGRRPRWVGR